MNSINLSIMIVFAILGLIIQCLFIYTENKKEYLKAVILKGSASLCFLTVGIVGFIYSKNPTISTLILVGLILGVIGDILLNLRFVVKKKPQLMFLLGTVSFLLGHIFYIIALFMYACKSDPKMIYIAVICALINTFIVGYFIVTKLTVKKPLKIFGIIYILIVALFSAVAVYNVIVNYNKFTLFTGIGSVLFFASDVILIFNSFGPKPKLSLRASNLILYFIGQVLIGFALLF